MLLPERDPFQFWTRRAELPPAYRFTRFLLDELLGSIEQPIVVSFDEIDVVLGLPFLHDEFFAAMRAVYDARASDARSRGAHVLPLGIASPGGLMKDARQPRSTSRQTRSPARRLHARRDGRLSPRARSRGG